MAEDVVITGLGIVCPIGIGREAVWNSLLAGCGGVRRLSAYDTSGLPIHFGGEVIDFDPKQYVRPRKSLKVMSRETHLAFAAADMAWNDSRLTTDGVAPERRGVVLGCDFLPCDPVELAPAMRASEVEGRVDLRRWGERALAEIYPLWLLKYLPNMPACHVGIAFDMRGPNNTITMGEVSSLLAVSEAARHIERGLADVMLAGGASSRLHPVTMVRGKSLEMSRRNDAPLLACRPFDADRDGLVYGEGAALFVLESRRHAEARRAPILARIAGTAATFAPPRSGAAAASDAIARGIRLALHAAALAPAEVGHVNAHGLSTTEDDRREAAAIRTAIPDIPVTAPKSFFGHLGAGGGAVELAVSVLALQHGQVPQTLNYERPDPSCPIPVIHGAALAGRPSTAVVLNQAQTGQAAAIAIAAP